MGLIDLRGLRKGFCTSVILMAVLWVLAACSADTKIKENSQDVNNILGGGPMLLAADRNGDLWQVNMSNGQASPFAETYTMNSGNAAKIGVVSSMVWDPVRKALYLGTGGVASCVGCLYDYPAFYGSTVLVYASTQLGGVGAMPGLTFRASDSKLLAVNDNLVSIDPASGFLATSLGAISGITYGGRGLTFGPNGTLYLTENSNLNSLTQTTPTATNLGTLTYPNGTSFDPLFPRSGAPKVNSLTTTSSGQIFGLAQDGGLGAPTYLVNIDPATLTAMVVGPTLPDLDGLAWLPAPPPVGPPAAPMNLWFQNGNYSVLVNWDPGIVNKVWDIYWSTTSMGGNTALATGWALGLTQPEFWHTGIAYPNTYNYLVRARNEKGTSLPSQEGWTFVYSDPSITPTGLVVGPVSADVLQLKWNHVPGAQTYKVYWKVGSSMLSNKALADGVFTGVMGEQFQHTGTPGTTYYYMVTAVTTGLESTFPSAEVSGVMPGAPIASYTFDDGTLQGWTTNGLWHVSSHAAVSPPDAVWYANEGTGTFNTGSQNAGDLISPPIILSSGSPWLTFDYHMNGEAGDGTFTTFDKLTVLISTDSGFTWTPLEQLVDHENGFTLHQISLAAYTGLTAMIRFNFDTVDSAFNDFDGAMIDNVTIY